MMLDGTGMPVSQTTSSPRARQAKMTDSCSRIMMCVTVGLFVFGLQS